MAEVETSPAVENGKELKEEIKTEEEKGLKAEIKTGEENGPKAEVETEKENGSAEGPTSDLEKKIIRQIEYYFGDINLPKDKFLRDQMRLDDGWIPLDIMLKFRRLSSLTTDIHVILTALQKSTDQLMEVDVANKKIRRSTERPLPIQNEDRRQELMGRTLYVKGFPQDAELDTLLDFFSQYGPIENVTRRAYRGKEKNSFTFKGSVFVIFPTKEKAEEFMKLETVKFKDADLLKKWQSVYIEEKRKQRGESKKQSKKSGGDQKKQENESDQGFCKGSVMQLKGLPGDVSREDLRKKMTDLGAEVAYINFDKGENESFVRLQGEGSCKEFIEKLEDSKFDFNGCEVEVRALEEEEEATFLEKAKGEMLRRRQHNFRGKRGGGRRGGGGRGGFQGNRKRKGGHSNDGPPEKKDTAAKKEDETSD